MWAPRAVVGGLLTFGCTLGLAAACQQEVKQQPPYHTPAPPNNVNNPASPAQRESVLAYARRLDYDSLIHGAADRQRLTYFDRATGYRVGPLATIYPERGANQNVGGDLGGRGRIIGRIESDSPYAKLGLAKGVNYIWVDSLMIYGDTGIGRAIVVSESDTQPVVLPMFYIKNPGSGGGPALARWLFRPQDDAAWLTCERSGCCAVGVSSSAGLNLTTGLY